MLKVKKRLFTLNNLRKLKIYIRRKLLKQRKNVKSIKREMKKSEEIRQCQILDLSKSNPPKTHQRCPSYLMEGTFCFLFIFKKLSLFYFHIDF